MVARRCVRPASPSGRWEAPKVPARATTCGSARAADRPAECPAHHVDHLIDVLVGLAALGGGADAALDVVLEDEDRQGIDRGPQRGGLLEDVDAVLLALDHPRDTADLALHARQASHELGRVLRVAVPEMARVGRRGAPEVLVAMAASYPPGVSARNLVRVRGYRIGVDGSLE